MRDTKFGTVGSHRIIALKLTNVITQGHIPTNEKKKKRIYIANLFVIGLGWPRVMAFVVSNYLLCSYKTMSGTSILNYPSTPIYFRFLVFFFASANLFGAPKPLPVVFPSHLSPKTVSRL